MVRNLNETIDQSKESEFLPWGYLMALKLNLDEIFRSQGTISAKLYICI